MEKENFAAPPEMFSPMNKELVDAINGFYGSPYREPDMREKSKTDEETDTMEDENEITMHNLVLKAKQILEWQHRTGRDGFTATKSIEECSEFILELAKQMNKKGCVDDILEEACDVLATVIILLVSYGVNSEAIKYQIMYKYDRAIRRFEEENGGYGG